LELAEEAGISVGAVWSVEQGNNPTLRVICNALDVLGYELVLRRKYE
jgi:transcriptional regulator with XRE-family HTH domain